MFFRVITRLLLIIFIFILYFTISLPGEAETAVPVAGVSVSPSSLVLERGTSRTITATISPGNAGNQTVRWVSSNDQVVQVTPEGTLSARVKGVSAGTATITVTTEEGGKTAACQVRVLVPVSSVALDLSEVTMLRSNLEELRATIFPSDATNQAVRWESSDESVVRVVPGDNLTATIRAYEPGIAQVSVITEDGNKRAFTRVEVILMVKSLQLDPQEVTLSLGEVLQLEARVFPENATDQRLNWESSDNRVAYVNETGLVRARSTGQARIVAKSAVNSSIYDYCTVTVQEDTSWAEEESLEDEPPEPVGEEDRGEKDGVIQQDIPKEDQNDFPEGVSPPEAERNSGLFIFSLAVIALLLVLMGTILLINKIYSRR